MKLLLVTQVVDSEHPILGFFHRWIEEFAKHCEGVVVICLQEGKHDFPKNVRVLSLGKESGASRLTYLKHFYSYVWNERKNYDAVFVHMNQIYVILGGLLWRMLGKRVSLWYAHGSVPLSLYPAVFLSHVMFTSTAHGLRLATSKKRIVGQGIDTRQFSYREHDGADAFRLITIGRVSPVKNIELLIDVVARLHARDIPCTFTIVGDADGERQHTYKHSLIQQVRGRDIESAVTWMGAQVHGNIPALLGTHDVFLHASRTGSLDKTLLEALAVGTLPVTSNEALSEDLPDELHAVCVARSGDAESYVRSLLSIRSLSETESDRLRSLGRAYVEKHHALVPLIDTITRTLRAAF